MYTNWIELIDVSAVLLVFLQTLETNWHLHSLEISTAFTMILFLTQSWCYFKKIINNFHEFVKQNVDYDSSSKYDFGTDKCKFAHPQHWETSLGQTNASAYIHSTGKQVWYISCQSVTLKLAIACTPPKNLKNMCDFFLTYIYLFLIDIIHLNMCYSRSHIVSSLIFWAQPLRIISGLRSHVSTGS